MYQPASRYWLFQTYETLIFAGLALLLALFCLWWINRHRTTTRRITETTRRAAVEVP